MKLITKEIIKLFEKYPIASQDGKRGDATVIVKFFYPAGAATWLITEGNLIKDEHGNVSDIEMFGFCCPMGVECGELGYVMLSDLESVEVIPGLKVERDLYFSNGKINLRDACMKCFRTIPELFDYPLYYSIYQLKKNDDNRHLRFAGFNELENGLADIKAENYYQVYRDKYEDNIDMTKSSEQLSLCNSLYSLLNSDMPMPLGWYGHSLSVSDIIILEKGNIKSAYYVDAIGFKQLPDSLVGQLETEQHNYLPVQLVMFLKNMDRYEFNDNLEIGQTDEDAIDDIRKQLNDKKARESILKTLREYFENLETILSNTIIKKLSLINDSLRMKYLIRMVSQYQEETEDNNG